MSTSGPDASGWSFAADYNWGSTALIQAHGGEALIVDTEMRELRITARHALTRRFAVQLQLPWRELSAGSLDGFIDDWHDLFGLPDGARRVLPNDQIRIAYARDGLAVLDVDSSQSGFGDISLDLGYDLLSGPSSAAAVWVSLDLPTGDAAKLAGNEALDASLILSTHHRWSERWSIFAQGAITWLGEGDFLPDQQRTIVWSGLAGVSWRVLRPLELKLQIDAHSGAFDDSELDFLNESLTCTVGASFHFASRWRIDLGVTEDIAVDTAPDVVFVIGVHRR